MELSFSVKLDCGFCTASIAKTEIKKTGTFICFINLQSGLACNTAAMCELVVVVATWT